jgi:hypothetical protein
MTATNVRDSPGPGPSGSASPGHSGRCAYGERETGDNEGHTGEVVVVRATKGGIAELAFDTIEASQEP